MLLPSINLIIYICIGVTVLSSISSIFAWIFLSSIGTKLSILEREVDKRSLEFDTLKKENSDNIQISSGASVIQDPDQNLQTTSTIEDSGMLETIQIFRNVRGTFKDAKSSSVESSENTTYQLNGKNDLNQISDNQLQPPSFSPDNKPHSNAIAPMGSSSHSSIYKKQNIKTGTTGIKKSAGSERIILTLYSNLIKDADFHMLWKNISAILQTNSNPLIAIDFTDINFLYEKEMDYLEKINYLITKQGGSLTLINCDNDLQTLLNRKQPLKSIVSL